MCVLPFECILAHLLYSGVESSSSTQRSQIASNVQIYLYLIQLLSLFWYVHVWSSAFHVYSDVPWFRSTSVLLLLCRLVYVTGKVENRAKTLSWLILLILFHSCWFQHVGRFASLASFLLALSVKWSTHCTGFMCC